MTTLINAVASTGLSVSSDGSGLLKVQSNGVTTNALAWGSYAFVASGSTPTLRSSYNISSITRNSAGNFTLAFTASTTDANYATVGTANVGASNTPTSAEVLMPYSKSTSSVSLVTNYATGLTGGGTSYDYGFDFAIFGN